MPAPSLTLANRQIVKTHRGLSDLSGIKGKDDGEIVRFDFDDSLSWNIAKDEAIFEAAVVTYDRAKKTLAAKHGIVEGQQVTDVNAASISKFLEALEALRDQTNELTGVLRLSRKELQKGGAIPPSILSALMPILDDK